MNTEVSSHEDVVKRRPPPSEQKVCRDSCKLMWLSLSSNSHTAIDGGVLPGQSSYDEKVILEQKLTWLKQLQVIASLSLPPLLSTPLLSLLINAPFQGAKYIGHIFPTLNERIMADKIINQKKIFFFYAILLTLIHLLSWTTFLANMPCWTASRCRHVTLKP